MDKMKLFAIGLAVVLVVSGVFVSANFLQEEEKAEVCVQPECGSGTCNFECGGDCGIPSCGCG